MDDALSIIRGFIFLLIALFLYFLPFVVARSRGMANRWSILTLNLFLGWTLVGWVVSLCWSVAGTAEIKRA